MELLIKVVVNAVALVVAANVVPGLHLAIPANFDKPEQWTGIVVIALVFALINSYIKPILKLLTLPIGILTMGLTALVINAGLLLGVAWLVDRFKDLHVAFTVGHFPPTLDYEALGAAVVGSIVISIVATVLNLVLAPRRAFRL